MAKRVLVTGAAGFVGRHLCRHLVEQGHEVHGLGRSGPAAGWPGAWHVGDVTDPDRMREVAAAVRPELVFHLAVLTKGTLASLLATNVGGTESLLGALAALAPAARVVVTGSAAEYGFARAEELPLGEEQPLRPLSPYGLSKAAQSLLAAQVAHRRELCVLRTRSFNLTGPGEPETLVCAAFARQLVEIELGLRPPVIRVGNLAASRDFLDVRDAVRAYALVAEQAESGAVFNVASGVAVRIAELLALLQELAGVSAEVEHEPARRVPWDVPEHCGDSTKLRRATGWEPRIALRQSLADLLDDWRAELGARR